MFEAGAQWFPAKRAGLEVWIARDGAEEEAASSAYDTTLTYISRQPPDHVPREFTYERSADWPPVRTVVRRWTVGLNGALRPVSSPRVSWIVSGGLAWVRLSGTAEPLGFTTFVLGGHSVPGFEPPPGDAIDEALADSTARVSTRSLRVVAGLKAVF